jgi:hypothetical protein
VAARERSSSLVFWISPSGLDLQQLRTRGNFAVDMRRDLDVVAISIKALCGIWANRKSFLLATRRRADRVMPEFEWTRLLSI